MSLPSSFAPVQTIDDLLVSILIYNYKGEHLENCLQTIFTQTALKNFEVIICDDATHDFDWEIANRYARLHDGKITITRNNVAFGREKNRDKGTQMCRGRYSVELTESSEFLPSYVRQCIERIEADIYLEHSYITKIKPSNYFRPPRSAEREIRTQAEKQPLVSICVYNYNYGRYLKQCLSSAFAQTYQNIEICFSDNASSDDSWAIASEFANAYPDKMSLTRNRINFGPNINLFNCVLNARGKYVLKLCSDDAMHPEFIERCVLALERYPEAAFAMVHREVIDEHNNSFPEPSFYDQSCLIPGPEQAAVYMMSSINPSISQVLYNAQKLDGKRMAGNLNDRWFGDRIMDFHICCDSPVIYLKEPLLLNRVHNASDGARLEGNLLQCMSEFVLLHQLSDIAQGFASMNKAQERLAPAIEKLAKLCLRYCLRSLDDDENERAQRYFHLARAISLDIETDATFKAIAAYWAAPAEQQPALLRDLTGVANAVKRSVSYTPPQGSIPLDALFRTSVALPTAEPVE